MFDGIPRLHRYHMIMVTYMQGRRFIFQCFIESILFQNENSILVTPHNILIIGYYRYYWCDNPAACIRLGGSHIKESLRVEFRKILICVFIFVLQSIEAYYQFKGNPTEKYFFSFLPLYGLIFEKFFISQSLRVYTRVHKMNLTTEFHTIVSDYSSAMTNIGRSGHVIL